MENQKKPPSVNDPHEGEFLSGKEMLELERERLKSQDKKTEIAKMAIEANDAADKRMFDYHMSRLDSENDLSKEQIKIAKHLIYGGFTVFFISIALLLSMSFFGDESQSKTAFILLEKLMTALGGIAVYLLGKGTFNKLTKPPSE
ncbi:MAG: hypothetical protein KGZ88_11995 [Methylomicrobium sp.]|nr:hypothetical protein [Methylomicrobium sp.]